MQIVDQNRQTLEVSGYFDRRTVVVITINKGKKDERDIVLDTRDARDLVKELTDYL